MIEGLKPYAKLKPSGALWLPEIPATWDMRRNGRLFVERNETNAGELPILEVSLRTGVRVRNFDAGSRKQVMEDREKYKRARKGDLAYNMMRMWQGAVGVVPTDGLVSPAYVVARPMPGVLPAYFEYLFRTDAYKRQVNDYSRGIVADRNRLYWDSFKQIPTPFPPPEEQGAIVRFLDHADRQINRYIRAKRKLIALLNEQKQAIIHRAVTRGLDPNVKLKPSGVEWLGEVPEHWDLWRAKYLFREVDQRSISGEETLLSLRMHRGLVPHADVSNIPIGPAALVGFKKVRDGLIVMNRMRAAIGMFGLANQDGLVSPDYAVFQARKDIALQYFLSLFKLPAIGKKFRIESKGLGTGSSGFMRLYTDRFGIVPLPVPPRHEQTKIVHHLAAATKDLDEIQASANREIELLRAYRTRLVADVVTGKLDVRDAAAKLPDHTEDHDSDPSDDEEFADEEGATDDDPIAEAAE